jgi:oxepin-CoA hydrolase/3-oxo-5,6-dehydrosuberyl-CoA semialdehyde dehydrogenase
METLKSYVGGQFVTGKGKQAPLYNPTTGEQVAETSTEGIDFGAALAHSRDAGKKLRAMSFAERGEVLRGMSKAIHAAREELIEIGVKNAGNTRGDAKFDIDGASGTLMAYADLGTQLGEGTFLVDGDPISMGRSSRLAGQHVHVPREGVAIHINAFNFPAWGLAEKIACAFLAGVPVIGKPATATAWMTARLVERVIEAKVVPEGALSLLCGSTGDLLSRLGPQDILAFTGSSDTGVRLKTTPNIVSLATRVNIEADSLNAAVLGPDVERGSETYQLFVADVARDVTQKAGQKCTAIRRVIVPSAILDAVKEDLAERITSAKIGDPSRDGMQVGPVATADQLRDVRAGIEKLLASERVKLVVGGTARPKALEGIDSDKGFFVAPTLLVAEDARAAAIVHQHEVFGPSTTLMPYDGTAHDAAEIVKLGQGVLVSSVYTDDKAFAKDAVLGIAAWAGRVFIGSAKVAGVSLGPGTVLPHFIHGGPGRAGGGEELGGLRGVQGYMQRIAMQGFGPLVESIAAGGKRALRRGRRGRGRRFHARLRGVHAGVAGGGGARSGRGDGARPRRCFARGTGGDGRRGQGKRLVRTEERGALRRRVADEAADQRDRRGADGHASGVGRRAGRAGGGDVGGDDRRRLGRDGECALDRRRQRLAELGRRREALARLLAHRAEQHGVDLVGQPRASRDRPRLVRLDLRGHAHRVVAGERALAARRLVQSRRERELVALGREGAAGEGLGRGVRGRADEAAMARERRVRQLGDAEIGDFCPVRRENDVLGLHVAMKHAGQVRDGERPAHLAGEPRHLQRRKATAVQSLLEVGPAHVLEHEVQADGVVLAHVVQGHQVRVRHAGGGLRFVPHPRDEPGHHLGREAEIVAQHLDGDVAVQHRIPRQQDLAHRSLPEHARNLVAANGLGEEREGRRHEGSSRTPIVFAPPARTRRNFGRPGEKSATIGEDGLCRSRGEVGHAVCSGRCGASGIRQGDSRCGER